MFTTALDLLDKLVQFSPKKVVSSVPYVFLHVLELLRYHCSLYLQRISIDEALQHPYIAPLNQEGQQVQRCMLLSFQHTLETWDSL